VSYAELEALEGRLINRFTESELRLSREIGTAFWRMVALILPIYALVIGAILAVALAAINILDRLP
jgi:hypothetical protein